MQADRKGVDRWIQWEDSKKNVGLLTISLSAPIPLTCHFVLKTFLQTEHCSGYSEMWILRWRRRVRSSLKVFSHCVHENVFSIVCACAENSWSRSQKRRWSSPSCAPAQTQQIKVLKRRRNSVLHRVHLRRNSWSRSQKRRRNSVLHRVHLRRHSRSRSQKRKKKQCSPSCAPAQKQLIKVSKTKKK